MVSPAAESPPPEFFFFEALSPEALRASAMIGTMQKSAPNHRLIFSIVGLRKVSECGSGKGLAVAGMVISIVSMVLYIIIIASASCAAAALM